MESQKKELNMNKRNISLFTLVILCLTSTHQSSAANILTRTSPNTKSQSTTTPEAKSILFTPPPGWKLADSNSLLPSVKTMVVGKGAHEYPPSINLGTEVYSGTLKQYLKRIKEINDSEGASWKDLGKLRTQAGEASLSQVDKKTEWGEVRMMHVILKKDGIIYILTAASLKNEFPKFYKDFFASMSSLRFSDK